MTKQRRFVLPYILALAAAVALCIFAFGRLNEARKANDAALVQNTQVASELAEVVGENDELARQLEAAREERAERIKLLAYWRDLCAELEGYIDEAS